MSTEVAEGGRARFLFLLLFFLTLCTGFYLKHIGDVAAWTYYNWLWTYDFGFMRRALPGALLGLFVAPPIPYLTVARVALAIGLVLAIVLAWLSARVVNRHFHSVRSWLLVLGFLLAGFGIANVGQMLGTFEQINFVLTILALAILHRNPFSQLGWLIAGMLCALMVLIHEASVFFNVPVVLAYMFARANIDLLRPRTVTGALLALLLLPAMALALFLIRPMPDVAPAVLIEALRRRGAHDELTMVHDFASLFNTGLVWTFLNIMQMYRDLRLSWIGVACAAALLATLAALHAVLLTHYGILTRSWREAWRRWPTLLPVIVPCFALLLLGDLLRFTALVPLGLFLLYAFIALDLPSLDQQPFTRPARTIGAAMLLMWAASFWIFPAYGTAPHLPDRLKCILNFYPHGGEAPVYRELCLEQRIEYWRRGGQTR